MRKIFFNSGGLRPGWRLLIFVGIFICLGFFANLLVAKILHLRQRPFLDPVGMISDELQALIQVLIATWIMSRIECRPFLDYGIPVESPFGRNFRVGLAWGFASTSLLVGLIAALGGYRILRLAIHGAALWYFLALWTIANLLIGFSEEFQFRAYILATLADGIGFWASAILLSVGFGALHYFFKPHERWEDFVSTGLLGLFMCLSLRRTGTLAFAIGFHAAFDFANLFLWSGQNAGEHAVGHLLETRWQGPQWLTGGPLGPEASWMVFVVIALMFGSFTEPIDRRNFHATRLSLSGVDSDDLEAAVGRARIGGARGQARSVFVAHGVERAQSVLRAVRFDFQVVGDCLACWPVAKDHFVIGVFELEALQHGEW